MIMHFCSVTTCIVYHRGEPGVSQIQEIALLIGAPRIQEIALLVGAPRVSRIQEIALIVGAPRVSQIQEIAFASWSTESVLYTRNSFACFCTHDHKCLQNKGGVVL